MRTIYIDSDFKCHVFNDGSMTAIQTEFFDGKCDSYVEGHRYIPVGAVWVREDGEEFYGEMFSAWVNFDELDTEQRGYEQEKLADAENALAIFLGGETA